MASRRASGDRVLESRHLIGLFLGVVLLCGVFFTLGYVMGHTQYNGAVHAESAARRPETPAITDAANATGARNDSEWDFNKKPEDKLDTPTPAKAKASDRPDSSPPNSSVQAGPAVSDRSVPGPTAPAPTSSKPHTTSQAAPFSRLSRGSIVLQVAALRHQSDALAMASLLQKKRFPSFVSQPTPGDGLYRVQVGPYPSESAADAAKGALDHDGFKAIIKR